MRKQPSSRMCFACGRQNPIGLKLEFYEGSGPDQVQAEFAVPDEFQGYPGTVHGGIVATILDEVSGRAVMASTSDDNLMATLKISVRYLRPTPTATPLVAVGRVKRLGGRGARVVGEIRLADGTVTAECESLLASVPEELLKRWEPEKRHWKVDL